MPLSPTGKKQYGDSNWNEFSVYGFPGGINVKATPQELDDGDLTGCLNMYLRTDGGLEQRKGYTTRGTASGGTGFTGMARLCQTVVNGLAQTTTVKYLVAQNNVRGLWNVDTNSSINATAFAANSLPWTAVQFYNPTHNSTTNTTAGNTGASDCLVICTGVGGPYVFDGATVYTPIQWSAVAGARWVTLSNNVLWFGGIPGQPNLVAAMPLGNPEAIISFSTFSSTINFFTMSQPVTGMALLGAGAQSATVVGMGNYVSILSGTVPNTYQQQDIPVADGVLAGRTMISVLGQVFWLGRQGFYVFDGQSAPQRLSTKIEPWVLGDTTVIVPITGQTYAFQGDKTSYWAFFYNNRIHIAYDAVGLGNFTNLMVYDLVVGGWTVQQTNDYIASGCSLNGPGDPAPTQFVMGSQSAGQAFNWDVYSTGVSTSDNGAAIAANFSTKFFKVGLPGTPKRLMRWYPELFIGAFTGQATLITDYGQSVSVAVPLPSNAAGLYVYGTATMDGAATWSSGSRAFLGAPTTRIDANTTFEALAFYIATSSTNQPWVFQGLTGDYAQEARI